MQGASIRAARQMRGGGAAGRMIGEETFALNAGQAKSKICKIDDITVPGVSWH